MGGGGKLCCFAWAVLLLSSGSAAHIKYGKGTVESMGEAAGSTSSPVLVGVALEVGMITTSNRRYTRG
jgi:hypothetical protein